MRKIFNVPNLMASCPVETVQDARRDLISELPADVKERILQRLRTREAARTAVLSTHWNHVWLGHGRLVFDWDFFRGVKNCKGDSVLPFVKIITYVLLQRVGPVKKFTLDFPSYFDEPKPEQSDFDQWFLFLSRNGIEELNISICRPESRYKLPFCIVSCRTIKQLVLNGFDFDCGINSGCIFPGLTKLDFRNVEFKDNVNGIVYSIPNLEKLSFQSCEGIRNFEISAPKLDSLLVSSTVEVESRWLTLHLKSIKTLRLPTILSSWKDVKVASLMFPTAINLQVIEFFSLRCANEKQLMGVMQLLQKSPNLCELSITPGNITCSNNDDDIEAASRLLEGPNSCIINMDLKMLKTITISCFYGSTMELLFVKMLLAKSPALESFVIQEAYEINASDLIWSLKELLCFPRASTKAQIDVCKEAF